MMTVGEAFEIFKLLYADIKIERTIFHNLRPPHVLLLANVPHSVCICKYHYNFISIVESLSKAIETFPKTHRDLLDLVCCSITNENCMFGTCEKCNDLATFPDIDDQYKTAHNSWKQWIEDNGRPILKEVRGTLEEALFDLKKKMPQFKKHTFIKEVQSDYFKTCKNNLSSKEAIWQMDFAENYALVSQDEVQSAHWSHAQVTIFTCCVWLQNQKVLSYAVISDDRTHSKFSVWTFMSTILKELKTKLTQVNHYYIFTDNCAGQLKNKFSLSNICFFEKDFDVQVEWNFFASSHGKGAMDRVGGVVKRTAWQAVKARKTIITSAYKFFLYVSKKLTGIQTIHVEKEEVHKDAIMLTKRWESVIRIPKIQESHHYRPYNETDILVGKTSTSLMNRTCVFTNNPSCRKRLTYSDVYSSESDDELNQAHDGTPLPCENILDESKVNSGVFVLVKVNSEKNKKFQICCCVSI